MDELALFYLDFFVTFWGKQKSYKFEKQCICGVLAGFLLQSKTKIMTKQAETESFFLKKFGNLET
jgi:hypothetical protein